jgi:hypothetical protein
MPIILNKVPRATRGFPLMKQLFLDLGQKDFAGTVCKICGMHYDRSFHDEVKLHKKYHEEQMRMIWKHSETPLITLRLDSQERVDFVRVKSYQDVLSTKLKKIISWIENKISSASLSHESSIIFLLLNPSGPIIGFLSAAEKSEADLVDGNGNVLKQVNDCKLCVLLIWIDESYRRRRLSQVMIKGMCLKESIDPQEISFFSPNELGTKLARIIYNQDGLALINNKL